MAKAIVDEFITILMSSSRILVLSERGAWMFVAEDYESPWCSVESGNPDESRPDDPGSPETCLWDVYNSYAIENMSYIIALLDC